MVPVPLGGPGLPKKSQVKGQKRQDWDEFRSTYQQSFWYVVSDVTLVAHPVIGVEVVQDARDAHGRGVMAAPVDRIGDPRQPSREVAGHLDVHSGGLVLAGVQLRVIGPGPARKQGAVDDVLTA